MLKPQDVLVVLKLLCIEDKEEEWGFSELAKSLDISLGASHNAVGHLLSAALVKEGEDGAAVVQRKRLLEFLVHGVPAIYYPVKGGMVRGVPTATSGPSFSKKIDETTIAFVWPVANGRANGISLEPIYKTAPAAAALDARLYDLLTLVDVMRVGRSKEKRSAVSMLERMVFKDVKQRNAAADDDVAAADEGGSP